METELTILNSNLEVSGTIDTFDSFIWTDKYCGFGDFQIKTTPVSQILDLLDEEYYLSLPQSDHLMIVEALPIESNAETGNKVTCKGRSIETILERRIVWNTTVLTGDFQTAIKKLLDENAISPIVQARRISRLQFEWSTDPLITELEINTQCKDITLYAAIYNLCLSKNVGFKMVVNNTGKFVFSLYSGQDRSYGQLINPYVVFSPEFDNLTKSDYNKDVSRLKTITKVVGQGEGTEEIITTVEAPGGAGSDLARREMFTDATSITKIEPEGTLTDSEYLAHLVERGENFVAQLQQKGIEDLLSNAVIETFEGELDSTEMYTFGEDFFIGDIVQVVDEYNHESKSQATEVIFSEDESGIKMYPTFSAVV